jgi:hypothetical protein
LESRFHAASRAFILSRETPDEKVQLLMKDFIYQDAEKVKAIFFPCQPYSRVSPVVGSTVIVVKIMTTRPDRIIQIYIL